MEGRRKALEELQEAGRREVDAGREELRLAAEGLEKEKGDIKAAWKVCGSYTQSSWLGGYADSTQRSLGAAVVGTSKRLCYEKGSAPFAATLELVPCCVFPGRGRGTRSSSTVFSHSVMSFGEFFCLTVQYCMLVYLARVAALLSNE